MAKITLNASSRILYEEAIKMGIECIIFDDHETVLMKYQGKQWYTRGSRTSFQSSVGKTIADYKPLTKSILHHFHLPTSKSVTISSQGLTAETTSSLKHLHFPVVLKPVDERHGKGVIVGIKTLEELKNHYINGQKALVEEMLHGEEFRIVCVNYTFIAAAYRKPAHVIGDGQSTIEQLVAEKNTHPWRGSGHENNLTQIVIDDTVMANLDDLELTPLSIPNEGQEVLLRKTANLSTGGEAWNVSDQVHPENKKLFEDIARRCDLNVVGIDIMCDHLDQPIVEQDGAGVIEVNASPGLRMHHYPIQGEPVNVAQRILELCIKHA